jgi:hypothetical protein
MHATRSFYEIATKGFGSATIRINQDGRVWVTP